MESIATVVVTNRIKGGQKRIVNAIISVTKDSEGENVVWTSAFDGVHQIYTFDVSVVLEGAFMTKSQVADILREFNISEEVRRAEKKLADAPPKNIRTSTKPPLLYVRHARHPKSRRHIQRRTHHPRTKKKTGSFYTWAFRHLSLSNASTN